MSTKGDQVLLSCKFSNVVFSFFEYNFASAGDLETIQTCSSFLNLVSRLEVGIDVLTGLSLYFHYYYKTLLCIFSSFCKWVFG